MQISGSSASTFDAFCPDHPDPSTPDPVITATMAEVERIVTRLANACGEMPNNPILGELAGGRGRSSVLRALRRLEIAGIIRVEHNGNRRRVVVHALAKATAWGEARPGHSPYMHRAHGDTGPSRRPAKVRAPESRPLPAQLPEPEVLKSLRVLAVVPDVMTRDIICEPETCGFPLWGDGERPSRTIRAGMYCTAPVGPFGGLCAEHAALCYVPRRGRRTPTESSRLAA